MSLISTQGSYEEMLSLAEMSEKVNNKSMVNDIVVFNHRLGQFSLDSFPMRVDALLMILVRSGQGRLGIDLKEYEVGGNSLVVIQPQNYICLANIQEPLEITAVAVSKRIVDDVLPKFTDLLPLILHHRIDPVTNLSEAQTEVLNEFVDFIKTKLQAPATPYKMQKAICLLQAALFEVMDIHQTSDVFATAHRGRKDEIMAQFILEVSENFRENRQVSFYAERLSITPKHLSTVVKELSGRTAGEWIETYVIMEAKVLLKTTDKPIQEIAAMLSFPNQSFFGKYFKYQTGMSPSQYRRL